MSQKVFISAIMDRPALWQSKHVDYKKRHVNVELWGEIKDLFPGNEVSDLKKRWKNLKDSYRKELRKISTSTSSDPTGSNHEPQWKNFELMSFVRDEIITTTESNPAGTIAYVEIDSSTPYVDTMENPESPQDVKSPASVKSSASTQSNQERLPKKRRTPNELREEYLEIEKRKLKILERELSQKEDLLEKSEDYHFVMSLLPQMENLAPMQKMRLRLKFHQALMEEVSISQYGEDAVGHCE